MATEKQVAFMNKLIAEKQTDGQIDADNIHTLNTQQASHTIEWLLTLPNKPVTTVELEAGVYENEHGIFIVKWNREHTRQYAKQLVEISGERVNLNGESVSVEFVYASGAIRHITSEHRMPLDRAKELTVQYGRCLNCGRTLKDATSVERGIGPVCIKSFA